ncbi:hypothetical protein BRI6_0052 [plant metagenome]|uniref:Uncharacterized protein n=1 Tax=plant metagenome TaxID=1297885 RepID=A0A484UA18_9ZZZZ
MPGGLAGGIGEMCGHWAREGVVVEGWCVCDSAGRVSVPRSWA